jgi:hypothetical protein
MIILFSILLLIVITFYIKKNKEGYESKYKYTAVIIEPREHPALEFVLQNFNDNLSDEWQFLVFHGNKNKEYTEEICKKIFKPERVKLQNLNVDNLTIKDYNNLLVSKEFYNNIPTEVFLIFQTDSIICKSNKDLINDFINYDYIGAPWTDKTVGNGGLSLRKKSKMLEIINNCAYNNQAEDLYFTKACPNISRNIPSFEDAKRFSVETVYNDTSFGVHKPWNYIKGDYFKNKVLLCDGLDKLKELNK